MRRQATPRKITGRFVLAALLGFFGTVAAVNATMMRFAFTTMPGLEVESAYSAGMAYGSEIERAHRQERRGWSFDAHIDREAKDGAKIDLWARDAGGNPITRLDVTTKLERPADRRADLTLSLKEFGPGRYVGRLAAVAAGQWDLVTESRLNGEVVFASKNRIVLSHD